MNVEINNFSLAGRRAIAQQDWATVHLCANGILARQANHPEGLFLLGLVEKAARHPRKATEAFEAVLRVDASRYDAAVELASQYSMARRNGDVAALLGRCESMLDNSPKYLDMAGTTYVEIGQPEKAWPLYQKACELQPEMGIFRGNLAACAVYVGELDVAKETYKELLRENPHHQRNHYHLSRVAKAKDTEHIEQMLQALRETNLPPERNIFMHFAIGKEYEDLERWDEAFEHYQQGCDAAYKVSKYDVATDIAIVDKVIEVCSAEWLASSVPEERAGPRPLFIVGLPRTGTTLTERIVGSHSRVASVGETEFMQMVIRRESGITSVEKMTPEMIESAARKDAADIRDGYLDAVNYRLADNPLFIDKLPFNVLYLGFIARAWPDQPVILMRRNPMDSCFSMYKQVFTWAYKFSYNLDTLASYYVAYDRLCRHWREVLGDRLIEVTYEELVSDQESQTRMLLDRLGLESEEACLRFEKNAAPSTTASSVQVREKVHSGSVQRWRRFEQQLEPLRQQLEASGISTE